MNPNHISAYRALEIAQKALRTGDRSTARHYAVQAAHLAPDMEETWLMMAALAAPRASVAYLQKALEINPNSERARKGMLWAVKRLREQQTLAAAKPAPTPHSAPETQPAAAKSPARQRLPILPILLVLLCILGAMAAWASVAPASALLSSLFSTPNPTAPVNTIVIVPNPTETPLPTNTANPTATDTTQPTQPPSPVPTDTPPPTETATYQPLPTFTPLPTSTPFPTETPPLTATPAELPTLAISFPPTEEATPTTAPYAPGSAIRPSGVAADENWIDVDLSHQSLYAYTGDTLVNSFIVSTGTSQYPTVTGQYRVYWKLRYKDMSGPGYYLPDVPFTMFFYQGYAIHGTYWHNNFGTPMSHGCVNMSIPDLEWIYNFSQVGTLINVHY